MISSSSVLDPQRARAPLLSALQLVHTHRPCLQLVPILPVVTKADTMTVKESINYRRDLAHKLKNPSASVNVFLFAKETLDTCGVSQDSIVEIAASRPPYLVVCSNYNNEERMNQEEPELWPERRYIWGTSEAMNPQHSDLLLLRRLLLQEGVEEIAESKIQRCALACRCACREVPSLVSFAAS